MTKMTIIDYGMGNLQSVRNALEYLGCDVQITDDPFIISSADALILPGVGAFGEAMNNLRNHDLIEPLRDAVLAKEKPLLGICLGMQLLANISEERGHHCGLSFIPGQVKAIRVTKNLRLPHIGWNGVLLRRPDPLFNDLLDGDAFYFVHSYYFDCDPEWVVAVTDYGTDITAAVQRDHIFGVQFHPERSHKKGLHLLKNFVDYVKSSVRHR